MTCWILVRPYDIVSLVLPMKVYEKLFLEIVSYVGRASGILLRVRQAIVTPYRFCKLFVLRSTGQCFLVGVNMVRKGFILRLDEAIRLKATESLTIVIKLCCKVQHKQCSAGPT